MIRLTSGKKLPNKFTNSFFELNFLFNCNKIFSKTIGRPINFLLACANYSFQFFFHAWGNTFWQSSIADIADYLLVVAEVTKNKSIKNSKNCVEIIDFSDMK